MRSRWNRSEISDARKTFYDYLQVDQRLAVLFQLVSTDAAIVVRRGKRRIDRQTLLVAAQRFVDLIGEIHVRIAQTTPVEYVEPQ